MTKVKDLADLIAALPAETEPSGRALEVMRAMQADALTQMRALVVEQLKHDRILVEAYRALAERVLEVKLVHSSERAASTDARLAVARAQGAGRTPQGASHTKSSSDDAPESPGSSFPSMSPAEAFQQWRATQARAPMGDGERLTPVSHEEIIAPVPTPRAEGYGSFPIPGPKR